MSNIGAFYRCPKCKSRRAKYMDNAIYQCIACGTYRHKGREIVRNPAYTSEHCGKPKFILKPYERAK